MNNVNVTVEGSIEEIQILKDINLTLQKNKIYVITGPNGGGKSTLAKAIMGIIPVKNGSIFLNETDITDMGVTDRAKNGIGYAFQTPARFKGLTVSELLDLAAGGKEIDKFQILYDVGLCVQDYLDREIDTTFSGGELKRIEIASILARDLEIALFDEPEAGIDLWSFQRLTETFEKMHRQNKTTIVIISHQERILRLADEVILIADGRISDIMSNEDFLNQISCFETECAFKDKCIKGGN